MGLSWSDNSEYRGSKCDAILKNDISFDNVYNCKKKGSKQQPLVFTNSTDQPYAATPIPPPPIMQKKLARRNAAFYNGNTNYNNSPYYNNVSANASNYTNGATMYSNGHSATGMHQNNSHVSNNSHQQPHSNATGQVPQPMEAPMSMRRRPYNYRKNNPLLMSPFGTKPPKTPMPSSFPQKPLVNQTPLPPPSLPPRPPKPSTPLASKQPVLQRQMAMLRKRRSTAPPMIRRIGRMKRR